MTKLKTCLACGKLRKEKELVFYKGPIFFDNEVFESFLENDNVLCIECSKNVVKGEAIEKSNNN